MPWKADQRHVDAVAPCCQSVTKQAWERKYPDPWLKQWHTANTQLHVQILHAKCNLLIEAPASKCTLKALMMQGGSYCIIITDALKDVNVGHHNAS